LIRKILLPVDDSEYAQRNIEFTCELAKKLDAEVTLLHVVTMPASMVPEAYVDPKPFLEAGEKFLDGIKRKVEELGVKASSSIEVAYGNPAHTIVEYTKKGEFELVALGARGRSRMRNLILGSVADTVARNAPCPVLIIR